MPKKTSKSQADIAKAARAAIRRARIKGTPSNYDVAAMNKLKPKKRNNKVKQTGPR